MAKQPVTLPADLTSFVGRLHDVAAVRQLLSAARLVTLTGIGGVGKTRLAIRVAGEVRRAFPDGACLVELATVQEPALLPHVVIDALAISEQSNRDPLAVLCDALRQRRMLLILDNCEHLVCAAADLAHRVLQAAPDVEILATSRQALRIFGEHVYPVQPLPTPGPDAHFEPGTASRYPSVLLFADRSAAVVPGFTLTAENEAAVVRLCQRLDGIPLAIELASALLRVLSLDDLVSRLDDRFLLLREGSRDLAARHRALRTLIDGSHDLCTPNEQRLWARAAAFVGGFGTDALEAVCTDDEFPSQAVLETVAGLVDKSLFIREEKGAQVRFRMLGIIQAYGRARLVESGDEAIVRRRHRDWCRQLIERAAREWDSSRQPEWAGRLHSELPNLRCALEYCLADPREISVGLSMAALPWFWASMGYLTEGRLWLDRALALTDEPTCERAWALAGAAYLAVHQGDDGAVDALVDQAHTLAVQLADPAASAFATHLRGWQHFRCGDIAGAIPLFTEALERYAHTDVPTQYPGLVRIDLSGAYALCNELDQAAAAADDIIQQSRATGECCQLSYALVARGFVKLADGDFAGARTDLVEAIEIKRLFRDTLGLALGLDVLAWTAVSTGDAEYAATLLGAASTLWEISGAPVISTHLAVRRRRFERASRRMIGDGKFDAAFERGKVLTVDEAVTFALPQRPKPPCAPAPSGASLTRRQREVADMVAGGLSNKEIAARLVISQRTAETHVQNILVKLGFAARSQIANWVAHQSARI